MKKTRLSFSSVSKDSNAGENPPARQLAGGPVRQSAGGENKNGPKLGEKKKLTRGSTYQYSKKKYGPARRPSLFGTKGQYKNSNNDKIPPPEKGIIRIIPLGGLEEIGKN